MQPRLESTEKEPPRRLNSWLGEDRDLCVHEKRVDVSNGTGVAIIADSESGHFYINASGLPSRAVSPSPVSR